MLKYSSISLVQPSTSKKLIFMMHSHLLLVLIWVFMACVDFQLQYCCNIMQKRSSIDPMLEADKYPWETVTLVVNIVFLPVVPTFLVFYCTTKLLVQTGASKNLTIYPNKPPKHPITFWIHTVPLTQANQQRIGKFCIFLWIHTI